MHSLWQLLQQFFRITLFKVRPQDMPASPVVLYIAVAFALLVSLIRYFSIGTESYSMLRAFLEVLVPGALYYLLLYFFKLPGRFPQAFAAICGSTAIIYALTLPLLPTLISGVEGSSYDIAKYLIVVLELWSVTVTAYILKHTLDIGFATGISATIALGLCAYLIIESLSPSKPLVNSEELSYLDNTYFVSTSMYKA